VTVVVIVIFVALAVVFTGRNTSTAQVPATTKSSPSLSSSATAATPKFPASYSQKIDDYLTDTLDSIEQRKEGYENMRMEAQMRATSSYRIAADGTHEPVTMRNVDNVQMETGKYQLTVYCIGEGNTDIDFSIDGTSKHALLQCSADDVSQSKLNIDTDGMTSERSVTIKPSKHCESMIGYQLLYYKQQ
jgi:hypothetical protein